MNEIDRFQWQTIRDYYYLWFSYLSVDSTSAWILNNEIRMINKALDK